MLLAPANPILLDGPIGEAYLGESVFRFNCGTLGSRGILFYRLLQQTVITAPVTYQDVIQSPATGAQPKEAL